MTVSDHLVDAVPDDDTWYSSLAEAARTLAESQKTATRVLAMGLPATEVEVAIAHRLTLDTDQLCLMNRTGQSSLRRCAFSATSQSYRDVRLSQLAVLRRHRGLGARNDWVRVNRYGLINQLRDAQRLCAAGWRVGTTSAAQAHSMTYARPVI